MALAAAPAAEAGNGRIVAQIGAGAQSTSDPSRVVSYDPAGTRPRSLGEGLFPSAGTRGRIVFDRYCRSCSGSRRLRPVVTDSRGRLLRRIHLTRVTGFPIGPYWPTLSKDRKHLAFLRYSAAFGGKAALVVARDDGRHQHVLATYDEASWPSWSPNGRELALRANGQLLVVDAASGAARAIATDPHSRPHWSPDGSRIVFAAAPDPYVPFNAGVWTVASDGSGLHQLFVGGNPVWSPDGRYIASTFLASTFAKERIDIVVRTRSGRLVHRIRSTDAKELSWSPG